MCLDFGTSSYLYRKASLSLYGYIFYVGLYSLFAYSSGDTTIPNPFYTLNERRGFPDQGINDARKHASSDLEGIYTRSIIRLAGETWQMKLCPNIYFKTLLLLRFQ